MSAVVVRITMFKVKLRGLPPILLLTMLLVQEVARNVTEVVLNAVRVQPAGAAVDEAKTVPVPGSRKRIS